MARITTYKNSKFASFLSILGYLVMVFGIYAAFNDAVVGGIITLVIGFVLRVLAGVVSQRKSEKEAQNNNNNVL